MEVVLSESAELTHIEPSLIAAGILPELWKGTDIAVADVRAYFSGGKVIKIARQGYEEPVTIPKAPQAVVDEAIGCAVKEGKLWLTHGPTSLLSEEIPAGLLSDDARLQPPPAPIPATDVLASNLADAWTGETTTALAIADALSVKAGKPLPWATVRAAIDGACPGSLSGADRGLRTLAVRLRRGCEGERQASKRPTGNDPPPLPACRLRPAYWSPLLT